MDPSTYVNVYLNLAVQFAGGVVVSTTVKNYLQSGMGDQSTRALTQQGVLLNKIAAHLRAEGEIKGNNVPSVFYVDGWEFWQLSIARTFMGKGTPLEIQDTLWLASKFGLVDASTIYSYCDQNLGVDCGGFVANFWGIGYPQHGSAVTGSTGFKPRSFWGFDRSRRRRAAGDIEVGDAIIFFKHMVGDDTDLANTDPSKGGEAFHIGMVGEISVHGDRADLTIVESSGARAASGGNGVNARQVTGASLKTGKSLVYVDAGKNGDGQGVRLYFVGKQGNLTSYLPYAL